MDQPRIPEYLNTYEAYILYTVVHKLIGMAVSDQGVH